MLAAARTGLTHVIKQTIQKKANVNYQDKVVSYYLIITNTIIIKISS